MILKKYQRHREKVTADSQISELRTVFEQVKDSRRSNIQYSLPDICMSGYALFALKHDSLLSFETQTKAEKHNLETVFGLKQLPSDTQLRAVLDRVDPTFLRNQLAVKFETLRKTGIIKEFGYAIGAKTYHLLSCDGVQHFSSKKNNCPCCLVKKHRDGSHTYHHQMLCAAMVHPDKKEVFLMDAEPIKQQDGTSKNDCELNAAKRLHKHLFEQYETHTQKYRFLILEDALYANQPHIQLLESKGFDYILNVKPKSHKTLFNYINHKRKAGKLATFSYEKDGVKHEFEYLNNVLLNNSHPDLRVNFLRYVETDKKGKKTVFTWVSNIRMRQNRLTAIMRAGRARWKIENETFNTLKNLGYHFNHNFGHGKDHLSTMFAFLMFIAFYNDQLIAACSVHFKQLQQKLKTKLKIWQSIKAIFHTVRIYSFKEVYQKMAILFQIKLKRLSP